MGTNYYTKCKCCGNELHIGKSSAGWVFNFHLTDDLNSWKGWKEFLKDKDIVDEYGRDVPYEEFIAIVEYTRYNKRRHHDYYPDSEQDSEGFSFLPYEFS